VTAVLPQDMSEVEKSYSAFQISSRTLSLNKHLENDEKGLHDTTLIGYICCKYFLKVLSLREGFTEFFLFSGWYITEKGTVLT
jgi:hypothetical protein